MAPLLVGTEIYGKTIEHTYLGHTNTRNKLRISIMYFMYLQVSSEEAVCSCWNKEVSYIPFWSTICFIFETFIKLHTSHRRTSIWKKKLLTASLFYFLPWHFEPLSTSVCININCRSAHPLGYNNKVFIFFFMLSYLANLFYPLIEKHQVLRVPRSQRFHDDFL